jgi:hypothetical protein
MMMGTPGCARRRASAAPAANAAFARQHPVQQDQVGQHRVQLALRLLGPSSAHVGS